MLEQAKLRLQGQHATNRLIDHPDRHVAALERDRQAARIGVAHHVDVDARLQRKCGSLRDILRNPVLDEFCNGVEVAHHHAVESPAFAHRVPQQLGIGRRRHPGEIVEGRHDRGDAGLDGGAERRQIDFIQLPLGNVDRGVVTARRHRAVGADVLGSRADRIRPADVRSLEAAHLRARDLRRQPWIFSRRLDDAPPARIARDVKHRRKCHRDAGGAGLVSRHSRGALPQIRIERRRLSKRHRKDRPVAVQDVEAEDQRNAQPRFFERDALQPRRGCHTVSPDQATDPPGANVTKELGVLGRVRMNDIATGAAHRELPDLLLERHIAQQLFDECHAVSRRDLPSVAEPNGGRKSCSHPFDFRASARRAFVPRRRGNRRRPAPAPL